MYPVELIPDGTIHSLAVVLCCFSKLISGLGLSLISCLISDLVGDPGWIPSFLMAGRDDESHGSVGHWGVDDDAPRRHLDHRHHHEDRRHFEMQKFLQMGPKPLARGENPEVAENWLEWMEGCFRAFDCSGEQKMKATTFILELHFPPALRQENSLEVLNLKQGSMSIDQYQQQFLDILPVCPHHGTSSETKYDHFLQGLNHEIYDRITVCDDPTSYEGLMNRCHQGKIFALKKEQDNDESEHMIVGTFSLFGIHAFVLIDTGASHSFISARFVKRFKLLYISLDVLLAILTLMRHEVLANLLVVGCYFGFEDHQLCAKLMFLAIHGFDCIIEIDFLTTIEPQWITTSDLSSFILRMDIPVVGEFPNLFPDEIPGLPPVQDVEFGI
ncbi:uncharacterized protein [Henckelia pumila]|uniref:uncharacterized protein n=1 Tax=Henckelia pumila TaxID=405737 RepID=UPI003C6E55A7